MNLHRLVLPIIAFTFLVPVSFALAEPAGTRDGAACDLPNSGGSGRMYNGQCVAEYNYPSQSNIPVPSNGAINTQYLQGYKQSIVSVINNYLVPALMALAFIVFLWGIFKYFIWGAENEHDKGEGRKFALWGIIGFVIILSLWGIVNLVRDTLNFNQAGGNVPTYPTL